MKITYNNLKKYLPEKNINGNSFPILYAVNKFKYDFMEIYSFDKVKLVANVENHIFELDNPKSKEYNDYDELPF